MLEKLFTSRNRVKILSYLLFDTDETYLRALSNNLNISPSAVKREILNLKNIGLITNQNGRIKLNNKCNFLEELKNIFIKTDFVALLISNVIIKNKKIKFAVIFGSFAKGNFNQESDIDLLIIGNISSSECYKMLKIKEDLK
ncbi:MAG: nucleotidyltransferase domain-containing protein [Candidatus Pacearchaeota archaeon]